MAHLLGIDIGTSGTKTLICDQDGQVLATAMAEHAISSPKPGWSEQNPQDWWAATIAATRSVLQKAKLKGTDIGAIGLSGQMHGSVFLGDGPKPLRPALLWNDQRTTEQCAQIESKAGGRAALIELVANPALTGFTAPKILWVRQHQPKIYDKTKHILLPKDYIRYCMTGEYATEVSDASGTLLLDVVNRKWSDKLLSLLEIDRSLLPSLHESPEITGQLNAQAAGSLGLVEGTPVVGGAGDQAAGAVGNGIVTAGIVSATLGTSGVVFAHSESPTRDPQGRVHTMCHAVPGKWCVFGCMLSAGGSFQWYRNQLGQIEIAAAKKKKVDSYELLIAEAQKAPAGSEGLFFLPYLTGERCPHSDPNARGGWIGITARTTRAMLIRSLLEGVTFGMRDALEIMQQMGIPITQVRASGGGARSDFWRHLQADIYQQPLVITNAAEGPAYGVALLAGVGTGVWSSVEEACKASIKSVAKITPNKKLAAIYERSYRTYDKLYGDLKQRFGEMGNEIPNLKSQISDSTFATAQEQQLISAGVCAGIAARSLGLSFADRDSELIEYLKTVPNLPEEPLLPTPEVCMAVFKVEHRWASMVLERTGQFMRKAFRGTDFSKPMAHFLAIHHIADLSPRLKQLRPGTTVFLGDSMMDSRHWSTDAPYPALAGGYLQSLGVGPYVNSGIGSTTARFGLERFSKDVAAHKPVRVIIGFGGNDLNAGTSIRVIVQELATLIGRSQDLGADVVLQGLAGVVPDRLWWTGSPGDPKTNESLRQLNQALRETAAKESARFMDITTVVDDSDHCSDGIHLNQKGHENIATKLLRLWAE